MEWNLATDGMGDVFVRRDMKRLSKTSNDLLGHHNKWMTSDELMLEKMDVDQGESSQSHWILTLLWNQKSIVNVSYIHTLPV